MARLVEHERNTPYEIAEGTELPVYICACGLSKNKPFCDGSHKRTRDEEKRRGLLLRRRRAGESRKEILTPARGMRRARAAHAAIRAAQQRTPEAAKPARRLGRLALAQSPGHIALGGRRADFPRVRPRRAQPLASSAAPARETRRPPRTMLPLA